MNRNRRLLISLANVLQLAPLAGPTATALMMTYSFAQGRPLEGERLAQAMLVMLLLGCVGILVGFGAFLLLTIGAALSAYENERLRRSLWFWSFVWLLFFPVGSLVSAINLCMLYSTRQYGKTSVVQGSRSPAS